MQGNTALNVAVIGAGPAGLMAADVLAAGGYQVTIFERMPSVGRKLLMAGRGGLNLTHSEDLERFIGQYGTARHWIGPFVRQFPPDRLRHFVEELGLETFVGSSGRIFPKSMKASPLLRAWLPRLTARGVRIATGHYWVGIKCRDAALPVLLDFEVPDIIAQTGRLTVPVNAALLALGGASWPRLGSDGSWVPLLRHAAVSVAPLKPSNCGFEISWSDVFAQRFQGTPLKSIAISFAGRTVEGEAMITANGIEGGSIYALSPSLRDSIAEQGAAVLVVDLRPDLTVETLTSRLSRPRAKQSLSNFLRKAAGLSPVAIGLMREALRLGAAPAGSGDKPPAGTLPNSAAELARLIKACPLTLNATSGLNRAISSAGGIRQEAVDKHLMMRALPGVFAAGEMLDWEAPTGGYLLQASFATGVVAAHGVMQWLRQDSANRTAG